MEDESLKEKIRQILIGRPRDIKDPRLLHKLALIPLLAWVGLGADGLSSAAYGPEEAFRALGRHTYLAVFLALATALTVVIISSSYSKIIEHFPSGGGGYVVASYTLGPRLGVVSGSALLVDYVLTITVSIAACGDAVFSFLPGSWHSFKLEFELAVIVLLVLLNLRGVKESVTFLAPIFMVFITTHAFMILYGVFSHTSGFAPLFHRVKGDLERDLGLIGLGGMLLIFARAFSLGGGTYTGIEAVSNGLQILREPRVKNGKRTMAYLASSLAFTAGGILVCYLLLGVGPVEGKTLNAVLAGALFNRWSFGYWLALVTIFSEGSLLLVGAQAGFVDGPRVMANMAVDYWFPRRFASLSDRFTIQNGILLMGTAAAALLLYSRGRIETLVVMYSINVFLTFSLSQLGMTRYFSRKDRPEARRVRSLALHAVSFILCVTILAVTSVEKFALGGWLTLVITAAVVGLCFLTRAHYDKVRGGVRELDELLLNIPTRGEKNVAEVDKQARTAVQLVNGYNGFGVHTFLSVLRAFPGVYRNFLFVSVAEVDIGALKDSNAIASLTETTKAALSKYVDLARRLGFAADYRFEIGTDIVETATDLIESVSREFPSITVFAGRAVFPQPSLIHKVLHNETAFAIQHNLQWRGITTVVLPIRIRV